MKLLVGLPAFIAKPIFWGIFPSNWPKTSSFGDYFFRKAPIYTIHLKFGKNILCMVLHMREYSWVIKKIPEGYTWIILGGKMPKNMKIHRMTPSKLPVDTLKITDWYFFASENLQQLT